MSTYGSSNPGSSLGHQVADYRSDTVTKPCPEMRKAIAEAEVGDDVFGDDPTTIKLQETAARMLGKEAGLFVPTGELLDRYYSLWELCCETFLL